MPQKNETPLAATGGVSCNQLGCCLHELNIPEGSQEQAIPALIELHIDREILTASQGGCTCAT